MLIPHVGLIPTRRLEYETTYNTDESGIFVRIRLISVQPWPSNCRVFRLFRGFSLFIGSGQRPGWVSSVASWPLWLYWASAWVLALASFIFHFVTPFNCFVADLTVP